MEEKVHVCPPWVGRLMVSPLRKLYHNPQKILKAYIKLNDKIVEIGPGMGFFTIPMAKMVGEEGKVFCVDIQNEMLLNLKKRAAKYKVSEQVETILSDTHSFNMDELKDKIDFGLLFAVVHEVPDQQKLFNDLAQVIKKGGTVLFAEPKGHVKDEDWKNSLQFASKANFEVEEIISVNGSYAVILIKK